MYGVDLAGDWDHEDWQDDTWHAEGQEDEAWIMHLRADERNSRELSFDDDMPNWPIEGEGQGDLGGRLSCRLGSRHLQPPIPMSVSLLRRKMVIK